MRRLLRLIGVAAALASTVPAHAWGQSSPATPVVLSAEVDAIIHPVSAEFMVDTIDRADASNASLVVFTLRTPGGLVDSTRTIIARMLSAKTPVVVWVGPGGARAASAGFLLIVAADVAAMAPGTSIGAAHPVSGDGQPVDATLAKKAASDLAAYARSIAAKRGRNVELVDKAVTESRAFTEQEAQGADPPLVDLVASDLDGLIAQLEGRVVKRFDGTTVTLKTDGARIETVAMTWRQRLLSAVAHPQVAYLLLSLGTLGLTIELWNPGAILPGVVGGVCLLLAFFAFQVLPINLAGLALIVFGLVLLVLEIKVASFGLLAVGGLVSLIFGSMMLIDSPLPELQIGLRLIVPLTVALAGILLFLVRLAVQSQLRRSITGSAGMINEPGEALTSIPAGGTGRVATHGEIWNATADEDIGQGDRVRVVSVDGLAVRVQRVPSNLPGGSR